MPHACSANLKKTSLMRHTFSSSFAGRSAHSAGASAFFEESAERSIRAKRSTILRSFIPAQKYRGSFPAHFSLPRYRESPHQPRMRLCAPYCSLPTECLERYLRQCSRFRHLYHRKNYRPNHRRPKIRTNPNHQAPLIPKALPLPRCTSVSTPFTMRPHKNNFQFPHDCQRRATFPVPPARE